VVLAALALRCGDCISAERLADALWGDDPPASWHKIVQGCVVRLRRTLGREAVETSGAGYRLVLPVDDIDAARFERLALRGRALAAAGEHRRAAAAFVEALALWRGSAFGELEHWAPGQSEALRLAELRQSMQESLIEAQVHAGDDVIPAAMALVSEQPLRERRWALLATALYRSDRQAEALEALRRARTTLTDELGLDPGHELVVLERAILNHEPGLMRPTSPEAHGSGACPYKGLVRYDRDDAEWFFGRSEEVSRCLRALSASPLLLVVGPSGCGKSSLVLAGVVPQLEGVGGHIAVMTPGTDPQSALLSAIATPRGGPAIVVDQLEELFTAVHDQSVGVTFLDRLAEVASSGRRVIVVVRADQVSSTSVSPAFARLAERGLHLVTPMSEQEMRESIEGPAERAGLRLEAGLVELLLSEVEGEPGALPLLSHALAETWERREANVLTVDGYRATGGIRGAVARSAELLYESLNVPQRAAMRSVFLRMVSASIAGDPVVTRVPLQVFGDDQERGLVLDLLVHARLLTADERSVTIAHEAVVRAWPRLRSWLDEDSAGQRILRHVSLAADDWAARGRPDSELYRGGRLQAALDWRDRERPDLTALETAFLQAADMHARAEQAAAQRRVREQGRSNRRLRVALVATAAGLVLTLAATLVAVQQRRGAGRTASAAQIQRLVAQSLALRSTRRDLAALLAVEAYRRAPDAVTRSALLGTFTGSAGFLEYQPVPVPLSSGHLLGDGRTLLASGVDGVIREIDLERGRPVALFPAPALRAVSALISVSADQRTVAEASWEEGSPRGAGRNSLAVFDLASRQPRFPAIQLPMDVGAIAISPQGTHLAVAGEGDVIIYDTATGASPPVLPRVGSAAGTPGVRELDTLGPASEFAGDRHTAGLAFLGDGRLVVGSNQGVVRIVDPASGTVLERLTGAPALASNNLVLASADDTAIVTTGSRGVTGWDLRTRRALWTAQIGEDRCRSAALSPDTHSVLCGARSGQVASLDLANGVQTAATYDMQRAEVSTLAVTPDGRGLVELTDSAPVLARWRLDGTGPVASVLLPHASPDQYSPDGRMLLVAPASARPGQTPDPEVIDARTGAVLNRLGGYLTPVWTDAPGVLAVWDATGNGYLIDARTSRVLRPLEGGFGAPPDAGHAATRGGRLLAWGGGDSAFLKAWTVWDTATGKNVSAQNGPADWNSASLDAGAQRLVSAGAGGLASYDVRTGTQVGHAAGVLEAAVSPTNVVAGSSTDGALVFYDAPTLVSTGPSLPGVGDVRQFAFSGDGGLMAARGTDGIVRVVDMVRHAQLGDPIDLGPSGAQTIALSRDGKQLALPAPSGVVVWQLRADLWADAACRLAGRDLSSTEWATFLHGMGKYRKTCPA
jgi:DNA-binding SARP family transcriptional activator/WD40 repeat protein